MDASTQMNPELLQIQNRLLNLTNQIEFIHANIDRLTTDMKASGVQIDSLTHNLTHPDANQQIADNWSEIFIRLEEYQDKMDGLLSIAKQSAGSQQLNELSQALLETNGKVARNQDQLDELAKSLKKLTRTQFKANTLVENKDQHLNSAFTTLQDMAIRRETADENRSQQAAEQLDVLRKDARIELVAEILPAIDSLERALESGASLSTRQKQEIENYLQNASIKMPMAVAAPQTTHQKSTWGRIVSALVNSEDSTSQPLLPSVSEIESTALSEQAERHAANLSQMTASSDAWLDGLHLVRERFLSVLTTENVEPIPAMGEPFDPRLHVAVSTENREDVANNTIVGVLRAGYYQDGRILRYAEVSVARNNEPVVEPTIVMDEPSVAADEGEREVGEKDDNGIGIVEAAGSVAAVGAVAAVVDAALSDGSEIDVDDIELVEMPEVETPELDAGFSIDAEPVDTSLDIEMPEIEAVIDTPIPSNFELDNNIDDIETDAEADREVDTEINTNTESEPALSPESMSDYEPAVSKSYVDENAAVRTSIVNYMLGKPTETDDGGSNVPENGGTENVDMEDGDTNSVEITESSELLSPIFDTDEQVSMSSEMDKETFASVEQVTGDVMNDTRAQSQNQSQVDDAANNTVAQYPNKTNVQSDISWVQYESPKRGSWISRLFGNN